jgi:hypothetical protein
MNKKIEKTFLTDSKGMLVGGTGTCMCLIEKLNVRKGKTCLSMGMFCCLLAMGLSQCGGKNSGPSSGPVYLKSAPISLDVGRIELKYVIDIDENIRYLIDSRLPPAAVLSQWIKDQFIAHGSRGSLEINVEKLSLCSSAPEVDCEPRGISSFWQSRKKETYQGDLLVHLVWKNGSIDREMRITVCAKRSVHEGMSLKERQLVLTGVLSDLIEQAQSRMGYYIQQEWSSLLR